MNIQHQYRHRTATATTTTTSPQEISAGQSQTETATHPCNTAPTYRPVRLPLNLNFDPFTYNYNNAITNPPISLPSSARENTITLLAQSQLEGAPSYAYTIGQQALAQSMPMPFVAPTATVASRFASNAAVEHPLYTAPGLPPTAPMFPSPTPNNQPTLLWSDQLSQMSGGHGHPAMHTPIAMPFAQTHPGTVPNFPRPLHNTTPAPLTLAPFAPPPLHINTNLTTREHHVPQPQITAPSTWSPWGVSCPEIVVNSNPSLSPVDYPSSARSGTSSISPHDPHHNPYLLAYQSPTSSSTHYSPYSDLSVVTPSSFTSLFDLENSQKWLGNQVSHAESSAPNVGFDTRLLSALSPSKSPHDDHLGIHPQAGPHDVLPPPSRSAVMGPTIGMLQDLGRHSSSENSSDSTLRLTLGQSPYSAPAPTFRVAPPIAPSPDFPIPEMNEEDDDDPVPEYECTETASRKRRRKGEAISSVPLKQCFMGDPLRKILTLRILAKPWLRENKCEPAFLLKDDDVTTGLEKQVSSAFGMKKGDSLFKAFEGQGGQCPFDGCPNIEPRAHRRISHVRTHFGLRPFSCDPGRCSRCQARIERGHEAMRFYNRDGLREHNQPLELMDCTECGDRVLRNNMDRHLETKHGISRKRKFASRRKAYHSQRQR